MSPPGIDLRALRRYFRDTVPGVVGDIGVELIEGGRSNLTYLVTDGVGRWVLRRPPLGPLTPTAHDMGREFRVVAALHGSGVPVPAPVALCEGDDVLGVPFSVVSFVDGRVLRGEPPLAGGTAERCAAALVDTLADLHAVPYREVGLADFGRPDGYLERQVRRWRGQWDRVATRDLPALDALCASLGAALPRAGQAAVVHGDYRIDNVIFDHGLTRIAAVVDWEMAALGDPIADLGLLLAYWDPVGQPLLGHRHICGDPGFPDADGLVQRYAAASGRDPGDLAFYQALGYYKLAVVAEGIHRRHLACDTVGPGFAGVGAAVPALVHAGLHTLGVNR